MSMRKPNRKNEVATGTRRSPKQSPPPKKGAKGAEPAATDHPVEAEPAVERGERIQTGKAIARGGGGNAPVKGATADSSSVKKRRK